MVTKNARDSRRRILIDAQTRKWDSFEELNPWPAARCWALWCGIGHPEYRQFNVAAMLEQERAGLMPMPLYGCVERSAKVPGTCVVAVELVIESVVPQLWRS